MPKCSYCNKEFDRASGVMLIQNTGKILWFHSRKCEKYMLKIKRNPKRLKWTRSAKVVKAE
ncbi:MAG: 50S ribosomal protein L24e [DPANN group archaeon]|nr:50S ribosomal protein L24e [DPANN group archaeon]